MPALIPKHWKNRISLTKSQLTAYLKHPSLLFSSKPAISSTSLLLSFPRSGSSWVGSIIGQAMNVLYLREPVTTVHMTTSEKAISVFDPEKYGSAGKYQDLIKSTLSLSVPIADVIYRYTSQLSSAPHYKDVVIKEINPLAVDQYGEVDSTIYLVRHPFSVAKSYQALSWQTTDHFIKRFTKKELTLIDSLTTNIREADFWQQIGFLQGWIEARTKHTLLDKKCLNIRYEDICRCPEKEIEALLSFANLSSSKILDEELSASLASDIQVAAGDFSLKRNRSTIGRVSIKKADKKNYDMLLDSYQKGFLAYNQYHASDATISYDKQCSFVTIEDE